MEGKTLDGEVVAFSRFSDKVLVLNFWATWCAPCIAEMPSLARLREKTAGLPVHVACITREDREVVRTFLERRELNTPIYLLRGEAPACFDSRAVPATYIISRGGLIAFRHIGAAAWDAESVVAFVRGLAVAPAL
jgi:thiol-disulfide isomerase/thioredoxin